MAVVLGNTALKTSRISLGTVKFGRNSNVKYPETFELPDDAAIVDLLHCCMENGINLLDTAPAYGSSEERIGKLLPGSREDWILCSKVGENYDNHLSTYDYSADSVRSSIERSLRRLNTDYLDILLIHSDGHDQQIIEQSDVVAVLQSLKAEGVVRNIGMSTKTIDGTRAALSFSDVLMVTLNIEDQSHLEVVLEAQSKGCGLLLKKVLASGHKSPEESLSFVLDKVEQASAVVGTINPDHLLANVALAKGFSQKTG